MDYGFFLGGGGSICWTAQPHELMRLIHFIFKLDDLPSFWFIGNTETGIGLS